MEIDYLKINASQVLQNTMENTNDDTEWVNLYNDIMDKIIETSSEGKRHVTVTVEGFENQELIDHILRENDFRVYTLERNKLHIQW